MTRESGPSPRAAYVLFDFLLKLAHQHKLPAVVHRNSVRSRKL
jgi:hypothetical protein